jgi:hypothetical protein
VAIPVVAAVAMLAVVVDTTNFHLPSQHLEARASAGLLCLFR